MGKQVGTLVVPVIAGDPTSPVDGAMWYNSTTGKMRKREGGVTSDFGTAAGSFSPTITAPAAADVIQYDATNSVWKNNAAVQFDNAGIQDGDVPVYNSTTGRFAAGRRYKRVVLGADVTNNNGTANTLADVTGLSFPVLSGVTYKFRFFIVYTAATTTTGSRWTLNGPAATSLVYRSQYTLTATSVTNNEGMTAYGTPSGANATSLTAGNVAVIEGVIIPSAAGSVIARFASEVAISAIVAKAGLSFVEYEIIG